MQRVLLRVFPHPPRQDVVALEITVDVEESAVFNDNDLFTIPELGGTRRIEKRPDEPPLNADYALHFLARPAEVLGLASKPGWKPVDSLCVTCYPKR